MTCNNIQNLEDAYHNIIDSVMAYTAVEWRAQYHSDLSPIAWHIGHVVFIESYWIQQQLLGHQSEIEPITNLYLPWLNEKSQRHRLVPDKQVLLKDIASAHQRNIATLVNRDENTASALMKDDYLLLFLIQHYYQHSETLQQILLMRALQQNYPGFQSRVVMDARLANEPNLVYEDTDAVIGNKGDVAAYDNELPQHQVPLTPYGISSESVSNAAYLGFIQDQGYQRPEFWSQQGWHWRRTNDIKSPLHWRQDNNKHWYSITAQGASELKPEQAVTGVSHYEAQAFANYSGYRLPTEQEWEHAVTHDEQASLNYGQAWEWCANCFTPYPGFNAFPYEQYSQTWFDGNHMALRGGSEHTSPWIKRPSFRNFYTADKRHIFSGLRLAQ